MKTSVLDVQLPIGKTLAVSIILVLLVLFSLELVVRLPGVEALFKPQSYLLPDSYEIKLGLMKRRVSIPNCFVIGSSVANAAIHAEAISGEISSPDESMDCFNFSAPGIIPSRQVAIAEFVLTEYNPRVLVYGIYFGDVSRRSTGGQTPSLEDSPWLSYKAGTLNVQGALIEHSALFRTVLAYRKWVNHDYYELSAETLRFIQLTGQDGSLRNTAELGGAGLQLDPLSHQALFSFYENYSIANNELGAVQEIIDLARTHGTQIIVVETPVHPDLFVDIPELETKYQDFVTTMTELLAKQGVPFLRLEDLSILPNRTWVDDNHLNRTGSDIFTNWLSEPLQQAFGAP